MLLNAKPHTILFLAVLAVASSAPAEEAAPARTDTVRAKGTGDAWVFGDGSIEYDLNGGGTLAVFDASAAKLTVTGDGTRILNGTTVTFVNFQGAVSLEGTKLATHFSGGAVELRGSGSLSAMLSGQGQYWLGAAPPKDWNKDGTLVGVGLPPAPAPDPPGTPAVTQTRVADTDVPDDVVIEVPDPPVSTGSITYSYTTYPVVYGAVSVWPWYYSSLGPYRYSAYSGSCRSTRRVTSALRSYGGPSFRSRGFSRSPSIGSSTRVIHSRRSGSRSGHRSGRSGGRRR